MGTVFLLVGCSYHFNSCASRLQPQECKLDGLITLARFSLGSLKNFLERWTKRDFFVCSSQSWMCEANAVQSLNVLESVELSLGLPLVNDDTYSYTCPLYLHHHPTARDR